MAGIDDIAAERQRQIAAEGWDAAHDDAHTDGSLSRAAACYAAHASAYQRVSQDVSLDVYREIEPRNSAGTLGWPWDWKWWKPKDPRRDLVRAGALIAAEIDRLDRIKSVKPA